MTQISADPAKDSIDPIGLDGVLPSAGTEKPYDIVVASEDALAVLDGARVVYVNDAAVRLFGRARSDLVGKTPWEISPVPEIYGVSAKSVTREYIREAYDQGAVRFEWHHVRPDGVTLRLEVSLTRIDLPEGQRILITFRDISSIVIADQLLRSHSEFQSLLTKISKTLITADVDRVGENITKSLQRIGEGYGLDLVQLWWYRTGEDSVFCSHDWSSDGTTVAGRKVAFDRVSWATSRVWGGGGYHFKSLDEYPEEASQDRAYTEGEGIKSIFVTPILIEGKVHGAAAYSTIREERDWHRQTIAELEVLTRVLGSAWKREEYIRQIRTNEAELRRSQRAAKLGTYVETVAPGTSLDEEYGELRLSAVACDIFGIEPGEQTSQVVESRIHPDDCVDAVRIPRQDGDDNTTRRLTYRVRRPDGSEIRVEESAEIEYNDSGQPVRWFGTVQDVTEQWNARERLRRQFQYQNNLVQTSEAFLSGSEVNLDQKLYEALKYVGESYAIDQVSILRVDTDSGSVDIVHQWSETVKFDEVKRISRESVPWCIEMMLDGKTCLFSSIDDLPEQAAADREFFESIGVHSRLNIPIIFGSKVAASVSFLMYGERNEWTEELRNELSLFARVVVTAWHRSESIRLLEEREAELLRSQRVARVGSYVETALPGTSLEDTYGVPTLSDEALAIFQVERGSESIDLLVSRVHPDDREQFETIVRLLDESVSTCQHDYRVIRPDGSMIYVEDRIEVDRSEDGKVVRIFGTVMDVTERVESNLQLQEALHEIEQLKDRLQDENIYLRKEVRSAKRDQRLVGENAEFVSALVAAEKVAPTDVTVLILGETGTGKELVAREIHQNSVRRDTPLISVNCAALSSELIESELFGHEAGAFTGADQKRKGRFELADGGTLFLDEIGDLPTDVQAKILRALQTGEFERLGGMRTLNVDVRLITATNRNLKEMVREGSFRADLFYRINSFPIVLPALRDRKEDIALLANHFVEKHALKLGKRVQSISPQMIRRMEAMDWPGNVREMEGFIQRALIAANSTILDYADSDDKATEVQVPDLDTVQHEYIVNILDRCNWTVGGPKGAAALLGVAPSTLRSRMKKLGIQRPAR